MNKSAVTIDDVTSFALEVAIDAAKRAGKKLLSFLREETYWTRSKQDTSLQTAADMAAEEVILSTLQATFPDHHIKSEERGILSSSPSSPYYWNIDPLDGTENFVLGIPYFSSCLTFYHEQTPLLAVVYNPVTQDLFTAQQGRGAWLNGKRLAVSQQHTLQRSRAFFIPDFVTKRQSTTIILREMLYNHTRPIFFPTFTTLFVSISTSLLASPIFAFIYSGVSERYHMMVIRNDLAQCIREEMKGVMHSYRALLPDDEFPLTDKPTERFNRTLIDSLKKSRFYYFKGVTGRHIPSRLIDIKPKNLSCDLLLVDPRNDELLRLYILDRFGLGKNTQEMAFLLENVRKEIYMSIVALFDQAHQLNIEIKIGVYNCPIFSRTEILDDVAFISYFTEKTATDYPTTYVYKKDSFFYNTIYTDFRQTRDLLSLSMILNNHKTEVELQHFLTTIGCDCTTVPLSTLRKNAETFDTKFRKDLKATY